MTIASANLLPHIFTSADGSHNGATLDTLQSQTGDLAAAELSPEEAQFLALINQELGDIDSKQALENKDLISLINELESQIEESGDSVALTSEWLQILKSHFGTPSEAEDTPAGRVKSEELFINQPNEDLQLNQNRETVGSADSAKDSLVENVTVDADGEPLPLTWQEQAALQQKHSTAPENGMREKHAGTVISSHTDTRARGDTVQTANPQQAGAGMAADRSNDVSETSTESEFARNDAAKEKPVIIPSAREHFSALFKSAEPSVTVQNAAPIGVQALTPSPHSSSQLLSAATQPLTLPPQAQSAEWGQAIGERVALLINGNMNRAEIRIDPPHLGKLDIQIQLKDDSAVVMIQTQHAQTRDLIESAGARLREFLQDAGYSSVDVNVSHREHAESGQGHSHQNSLADADAGIISDQDPSAMHAAEIAINPQAGVIDYFA